MYRYNWRIPTCNVVPVRDCSTGTVMHVARVLVVRLYSPTSTVMVVAHELAMHLGGVPGDQKAQKVVTKYVYTKFFVRDPFFQ